MAEILQSLVPLMNALGVATERVVIDPPSQFFQVTKRIHNLLQGAEGGLSKKELEIYYGSIQQVADELRRRPVTADVWFFHDPQLLPLAGLLPRAPREVRIWVGHIDFTTPNPTVLDTLLPLVHDYDRLIFSLPSYVPAGLGETPLVSFAPPAIDPLSPVPPPPAYHTRFDRGVVLGPNLWNLGPPDGAIALGDMLSLLVQFGHHCDGPA